MGPTFQNHATLRWRFGTLSVQRFGAMLGPLTFVLPSGRSVSPLFEPPWAAEPVDAAVPGVIAHLRGEWPCVPFGLQPGSRGFTAPWAARLDACAAQSRRRAPALLHGHAANTAWRFTAISESVLELTCDHPRADPIRSLTRRICLVEDAPAVELALTVRVRRPIRLPVGLHFTFGNIADRVRIRPGRFAAGRTHPGPLGAAQVFAHDRAFSSLAAVPGMHGGELDAGLFPLREPGEDLLQLDGVDGRCSLDYAREAYRVTLSWNAAQFPSVLLWLSNRALEVPPLNGRTVALGVEPVCSAFGLGQAVSSGPNPIADAGIATAIEFDPAQPFETRYRMSVSELDCASELDPESR